MTMAIALFEHGGDVAVGPDAAEVLARLGVTSVSVLADVDAVAVVIEGWAFDLRAAAQAAAVVAPHAETAPRILYPLSDITVHRLDLKGVRT